MSLVDAAMTRDVIRDIVKHPLDISELQAHVQHGVIYLSGMVSKLKGYHENIDLHEEWNIVLRTLKQKPGIRDVISDVELVSMTLEERAKRPSRAYRR